MTSFLLIISFLLHIISISAIYALAKQLSTKKSADTSEIQYLMEKYLEEFRHENERLQQKISTSPTSKKQVEQVKADDKLNEIINSAPVVEEKEPDFIDDSVEDQVEVSLHSEILMLYKQGLPIEEIARKLGCGKTEVELIVKFHEKSNV